MVTPDQLTHFRTAAEKAWGDDTRHEAYKGHPQPSAGQCYVTSRWLTHHLGGHVARKGGHYFWLSPDEQHAIDLTGDRFASRPEKPELEGTKFDAEDSGLVYEPHHKTYRPGPVLYKKSDHPLFKGHEIVPAQESDNAFERSTLFMQRANHHLANPNSKTATDFVGDALPAEEPQAEENMNQRYWHDEPNHTPGQGEYQFIYAQGQLHVDPDLSHNDLAGHAQVIPETHQGPFAAGYVHLNMGKATWEVHGNISPNAIVRVLKDYGKHLGWQWGGLTDISGEPVGTGSEFAPKASGAQLYWYAYNDEQDHLYISRRLLNVLDEGHECGFFTREGNEIKLSRVVIPSEQARDALDEWTRDERLEIVATNDNVIKRIEDLQQDNLYSPQGDYDFSTPQQHDERQPGGVFRCPDCLNVYPSWDMYLLHRKDHPNQEPEQHSGMPELGNSDQPLQPRFMEQETPMVNTGSLKEALRVDGYYFENHDHHPDTYYVAYRYGSPIGVMSMYLDHINEIVVAPGQGYDQVRDALMRHAAFRHDELISHLHHPGFTFTAKDTFKWAKGTDSKDMIDAPVPFIYDVQDDNIAVGHPGARHSDIMGRFTPGGIVEGTYEPGGKVIIRSMTNMPYTVRHMLELWYYTHPHLEIKSIHLRDEQGKDTRLAAVARTGDPKLDGLIQQYIDEYWQGATSVHPQEVEGMCTEYAHEFADFLTQNGIQASVRYLDHPEEIGYTDRTRVPDPDEGHAVVQVGNHTIDFAASQYGYSEFPMILLDGQRLARVAGPPTRPPNYREATEDDSCKGCKMFDKGKCWGYGNVEVESDYVCDSFDPETREQYNKMSAADIGGYISSLVAADPATYSASQALHKAGGQVFVVGGAVRDALMGEEPKDLDLMVTGLPVENVRHALEQLPGRVDITGKDFGVFRYRQSGGGDVEIALPRRERSSGAGHKDFNVQADHTMKPEEDLYRRDFTPNAMAINLSNGRLIDPFGGAKDIQTGTFRALNGQSLREDPLRTMRALVLNGRYGLSPDELTKAQMAENASGMQSLPQERLQAELDKVLKSNDPAQAIQLAKDTGVLKYFLPEVDATFGYDQKNPHHAHDLGTHILNVVRNISQQTDDPDLRLAALLHDIGKPASAWWHPEHKRQKFYQYKADRDYLDEAGNVAIPAGGMVGQDHHTVGAEMARARMEALRFPADRTDRVSAIIQHHMYPAFDSPKGARRFLQRVEPHADDLMTLRDADMGGKGTDQSGKTPVAIQRSLVDQVRNQGQAFNRGQLKVNGADLVQLGVPMGPLVGQTLQQLVDAVVENPELNDRNTLLELARSYAGV